MSPSPPDRRFVLHVHRVGSVDEAAAVERAGADLVGFHVDDDVVFGYEQTPVFTDDRHQLLETVPELVGGLRRARAVVQVAAGQWTPELPGQLADQGAGLVQVDLDDLPGDELLGGCARAGLGVVYGGASIEPEDPPSRYRRIFLPDRPALAFYALQVFPSYPDGWTFLREVAPAHADEAVTIEDLELIAGDVPLLMSLNVDLSNCGEVVDALCAAHVRGLTFTLGSTESSSWRTFELDQVVEIIAAIRAAERA